VISLALIPVDETRPIEEQIKAAYGKNTQAAGGFTPTPSDYEKAMSLADSYGVFGRKSADEAARIAEAGQILDRNPATFMGASREMASAAQEVARLRINSPQDWEQFVKQYPKTADYLSNGQNMAMSHDDILALGQTERTIMNAARLDELNHARAEIGLRMQGAGADLNSLSTYEFLQLQNIDAERMRLSQELPQNTWTPQGLLSGMVQMGQSFATAGKYGAAGAAIGSVIPGAGTAAGFSKGFQVGFAKDFAATEMGNKYLDYLQKGVGTSDANIAAYTSGIGNAVIGSAALGSWIGKFPGGSEAWGVIQKAAEKYAAKLPAAAQVAAKDKAVTFLGSAFLHASEQFGFGVANVLIAEGADRMAEQLSGQQVVTDDRPLAEKAIEAGVQMVPLGMAFSIPHHIAPTLKKLGDIADKSKLRTRYPDAFADKVNADAAGTSLEQVRLDANELDAYLRSLPAEEGKAIADRLKFTDEQGLTIEAAKAIATGDDFIVTPGDFAVLDKKHRDALTEHVRDASGMTAKEATLRQELLSNTENQSHSVAADLGLTENSDYVAASERSKVAAKTSIDERNAADQKQTSQNSLKRLERQAQEEISQNPFYRVVDSLQRPFDLQLFGAAKSIKEVAKKYLDGKLNGEQQMIFEGIAQAAGREDATLSSGDALARAIIERPARDIAVKERVAKLAEDMKNREQGTKDEVARKSSLNEDQLKAIGMETEAIRGMVDGKRQTKEQVLSRWKEAERRFIQELKDAKTAEQITRLKEEIKQLLSDLRGTERWLEAEKNFMVELEKAKGAEEVRKLVERIGEMQAERRAEIDTRKSELGVKKALEQAREIIAGLPIKEAIAWGKYHSLERKAARAKEAAYRRGDYAEALRQAEIQMTNHALGLEAVRVEKQVKSLERVAKAALKWKPKKLQTEDHYFQAMELLRRFGFEKNGFDYGRRTESLAQWADRMQGITENVNIAEWLKVEGFTANFTEFTAAQFKDVIDAVRNVRTVANKENRMQSTARKEAYTQAIDGMVGEIGQGGYVRQPSETRIVRQIASKFRAAVDALRTFDNVVIKLGNYAESGRLFDFFAVERMKRLDRESVDIKAFEDGFRNVLDTLGFKQKDLDRMGKRVVVEELPGVDVTKWQLVMMALQLGNRGNYEKLLSTPPYGMERVPAWDGAVVNAILTKHLDARDWKLVQGIWDLIGAKWPQIAKTHKERSGFTPQQVEAVPFDIVLPDGSVIAMKGGYMPLVPDPRSEAKASQRSAKNIEVGQSSVPAWQVSTKNGFTKARSGSEYPVHLDIAVPFNHMADVIHWIHFGDYVVDFRRIVSDAKFRNAVEAKLGPEGLKLFERQLLEDAKADPYGKMGKDTIAGFMDWARGNAIAASIVGRVSTIVQNFANPILYPGAVKGYSLGDTLYATLKYGLLDYWPKTMFNWEAAKQMREEAYEKMPFLRDRRTAPDYTMRRMTKEVAGEGRPVMDFLTGLLAGSDELTAIPNALHAYEKKLAETGSPDEARIYAQRLVKDTIGSSRRSDVSNFVRSNDSGTRALNMLYSFMNVEFNRWDKEAGMASQNIANVPRFIGFVASRMIAFALLSDLLSGKHPDKKDDPATWIMSRMASYPLTLVPIVRDAAPIVLNHALGLKTYSYRPSPIVTPIEDIIDLGRKATGLSKGKTTPQDLAEKATEVASFLRPFPDQWNSWFWNAYDIYANDMDPEWDDVFKRRPKKERR
jgi:hypothetical protein